ncbi:hypothetical protein HRI_002484900 [Hibiscus trionum]|uniref:Uncharacterized protein n=1 Tax=Hibiscus trionum TaxID=183268 RepID=A0A9W7I3B5_HIBTR|nr:hypothetical protein HRI_002484900 [Hibiscus trionum]
MDESLSAAARTGNVGDLYRLIRLDGNALRRFDDVEFVDTPLHIAAEAGCIGFAMEIMNLKSSFARKLNQDGLSPMHLAVKKGHVEMALRFVEMDKDLVRVKGKSGKTPLHLISKLIKPLLVCPVVSGRAIIPQCPNGGIILIHRGNQSCRNLSSFYSMFRPMSCFFLTLALLKPFPNGYRTALQVLLAFLAMSFHLSILLISPSPTAVSVICRLSAIVFFLMVFMCITYKVSKLSISIVGCWMSFRWRYSLQMEF